MRLAVSTGFVDNLLSIRGVHVRIAEKKQRSHVVS